MRRPLFRSIAHARGFSLIELMVALVISLLVLVATVSFYLMTRSTYTTIDDSSNLEERGQFALGVITRALRQTAFSPPNTSGGGMIQLAQSDPPMISGLDGCDNPADVESLSQTVTASCKNTMVDKNNDALEVRFFGSGTAANPTVPDNSMVDCSGQGVASPTSIDLAASQRGLSIFFVQTDSTGPYLACKFRQRDSTGAATATFATQQLVPGVESLQFLYGVSVDGDAVPDVFKRATDMSTTDWQNVYAVKVALVVRADNASADIGSGAQKFTLFGKQYTYGDGTYQATANTQMARRLFTATVQTRNYMTCFSGDPSC
jgi:type IV pilus assembly protein PilW